MLEVPPRTRRRATLTFALQSGAPGVGFRAARSHAIVDLKECFVLTSALVSLIISFKNFVPALLRNNQEGELHLTECDNGIDVVLAVPRKNDPSATRALADWARRNEVVRIVLNDEIILQFDEPKIKFSEAEVAIPSKSFLQPTRVGEQFLQDIVRAALKRTTRIADLFAGCGTFTFALARGASVHAVDSDKAALSALENAARKAQKLKPVTTEARNLFSQPLQPLELKRFDAVLLDPPRAGASAQAAMLAKSAVRRVAYVSCNPETFARDARILVDGGFRIISVNMVDQFLWSSHIELAALLERQ
ncbi:MAG TPA: RsmD family RNA methyltransferase [Rhizomicrobium sp.]|jgi:23S rRNA (uracil1939-C5)-methyltransferase